MLQRAFNWLRGDLWRVAAIVLGVAVVALLVLSIGGSASESGGFLKAGDSSLPATTLGSAVDSTDSAAGPEGPDSPGSAESSDDGFLAIKVDNAPPARPQVGIGTAPLLIEVPVEGDITRFVALFTSNSSGVVGPIRSLRPVDVDLLPPFAVHVVSTGGQPFVTQAVDATGLQQITPVIYPGFISGGRQAPHDTFIDLDDLLPLIIGSEGAAVGLPKGELPSSSAEASIVQLPIGSVEFSFAEGLYTRHEAGEVFEVLDGPNGVAQPLTHDTVIIMSAAERPAGYEDSNGVPVSTFDVIGSGDLLVFHAGEVIEGTWSRSAQADPLVFLDSNGDLFGIPEGSTYLGVVPRDQQATFTP